MLKAIRKVLVWLCILPAHDHAECEYCAWFKKADNSLSFTESSCFMGHNYSYVCHNPLSAKQTSGFEPNIKPCPDFTGEK